MESGEAVDAEQAAEEHGRAKKIVVSKSKWKLDPSENCILAVHFRNNVNGIRLTDILRKLGASEYEDTIRRIDHGANDQEDFDRMNELAKLLGYPEGIEWED